MNKKEETNVYMHIKYMLYIHGCATKNNPIFHRLLDCIYPCGCKSLLLVH